MVQVKYFYSTAWIGKLEDEVNLWLDANQELITVINVSAYSRDANHYLVVSYSVK